MNHATIASGDRLATVTVSRTGLLTMSNASAEFLGWPAFVATAADAGGLVIAADPWPSSVPVSYGTTAAGQSSNGRFRCRAVIEAAGLVPNDAPSRRYLAVAHTTKDGRCAILVQPENAIGPRYGREPAGAVE
jgi:hypothetical protein